MSSDWVDSPEGWHKKPFLFVATDADHMQRSLPALAEGFQVPQGWLVDYFDVTSINPAGTPNHIEAKLRAKALHEYLTQWAVVISVGLTATKAMAFDILKWEDYDGTYVGAVPDPVREWYTSHREQVNEYLRGLGITGLVKPGHKCWIPPDETMWTCAFCGQDWLNGQRVG